MSKINDQTVPAALQQHMQPGEQLRNYAYGVKLPSLAIAPVHRADGSGTTFVFTSYLSAVSPEWKSKVGASTSVNWPAGAGAKGNYRKKCGSSA